MVLLASVSFNQLVHIPQWVSQIWDLLRLNQFRQKEHLHLDVAQSLEAQKQNSLGCQNEHLFD